MHCLGWYGKGPHADWRAHVHAGHCVEAALQSTVIQIVGVLHLHVRANLIDVCESQPLTLPTDQLNIAPQPLYCYHGICTDSLYEEFACKSVWIWDAQKGT